MFPKFLNRSRAGRDAASSTKLHIFPADWWNGGASDLVARSELCGRRWVEEIVQMALVVAFAAVLLVTGQLLMEYRSSKLFNGPAITTVISGAVKTQYDYTSRAVKARYD
jgi:hypothetical protein